MTPERASDRVRALAERGAVDPKGAEALLAALEPSRPSSRSVLLNPFERLAGLPSIVAALVVAAASVGVTLFAGARFDGLLDLHPGKGVSLSTALLDQVAAVLVPSFVYFAYARAVARGVRYVDFLGVVGLARLPLVVVAVPVLRLQGPVSPGQALGALFWVGAALALLAVIAHVTWLYQGFRTASGLAGAKLVGGFVGTTLVAEIVSKLVVSFAP